MLENRATRWVAVLFATALIAAACGDDGGADTAAEAKAETVEATTTTVASAFPEEVGPPPGMGTGDVEVTLHVPKGEVVVLTVIEPGDDPFLMDFNDRMSPNGGKWEIDGVDPDDPDRESCPGLVTSNAYWPTGMAPSGEYSVVLQAFEGCGAPEADVRLDIRVDGEVVSSETHTIPVGQNGRMAVQFDV